MWTFVSPYLCKLVLIFGSPTLLGLVLLGFCSSLSFPETFKLKWRIPFLLFLFYFSIFLFLFQNFVIFLKKDSGKSSIVIPLGKCLMNGTYKFASPFLYSATESSYIARLQSWVSVRLPNFRNFSAEVYCISVRGSSSLILYSWYSKMCEFQEDLVKFTKCYSLG